MNIARITLILSIFFSLSAFAAPGNNRSHRPRTQMVPQCASKEACLNDPDCYCWCSQICNWRKKTPEDHPVFIENDPYGKHCYCKQWDFDHYEDNCIFGRGVKQPPGAK